MYSRGAIVILPAAVSNLIQPAPKSHDWWFGTMRRRVTSALLTAFLWCSGARAEVGDPTLRTDHPHYAGEGAFQTVEDCVRFATEGKTGAQDRAIAMYLWLLTHQFHLMSPQEWCIPGRTPDTANPSDYESVVYDANRSRFSYGYGLCGTVHSWNEPYWKALGMPARRRAFPGHVNSEIFYDQAWHAFDTDMAGLLFRRDGVVAGYDDIIRDPSLVDSVRPPLPHYPFAWPGDFDTMKKGWLEVARGGNWFKLYNGGYAAHPGIVHLRAGESFTRWFDRDHFGGPEKRRFWHNLPGGPARNWAFVNGEPFHDGPKSNSRSDASYCNGEFIYRPDLTTRKYLEGLIAQTGSIAGRSQSPHLYSVDGKPASVTFRHFSPYVICGDPEDNANPMTGRATGGLVLMAEFIGMVDIEVSADEGQTWSAIETAKPAPTSRLRKVQMDLTEQVKGRYGWQVRITWERDSGIDKLQFTTVTQVCQAIYPRLKPGGTNVTYRAGNRGVVAVLPNFGLAETAANRFEETRLRSRNVVYRGRGPASRLAYESTDNKPAHVVFRIDSPHPLSQVVAAVRYPIRVPPLERREFALDVSTDNGQTWATFARAEIPPDNEFSSGWLSGSADVAQAKSKQALVRVRLDAGGHRTGILDAQFYGVYQTGPPGAVTIDFGWKQAGEQKSFMHAIPAGEQERSFAVPTGDKLVDDYVRLTVK